MPDETSHRPESDRRELRATHQHDFVIREAAQSEHSMVTAGAKKVIEPRRDLTLTDEAFDRFVAELDKPEDAVPQLTELFQRHPKLPEA